MSSQLLIAVAVFVIAYAAIISERVHRTVAALAGAVVLVVAGVVHQDKAIGGIDFNTLGLLIGMMVIVGIAKESGMFQYVALLACRVGRGRPMPIFLLMGLITAVFSALLDNVTTVLLMTPVLFVVTSNLGVKPMPWLVATILLSNIGGTSTLIGDPPNIMIGSAADIPFDAFILHLGPVAAVVGVVTAALTMLVYRKELVAQPGAAERILQFDPKASIQDKGLLIKSLVVIGLVLLGFLTHGATHLEGATIALTGAVLLLLLTGDDPEHVLHDVEWTTIFFFMGLFVLVGGLEEVGAISWLAGQLVAATGGNLAVTAVAVLWGSAVCSAIVDNIPFVATMIPLVQDIGAAGHMDVEPLWWALALGADIGGNATLVGASANVVVAGLAEKMGQPIGFVAYLKVAVPMTVVGIAIANVYLWLFYL